MKSAQGEAAKFKRAGLLQMNLIEQDSFASDWIKIYDARFDQSKTALLLVSPRIHQSHDQSNYLDNFSYRSVKQTKQL